MVSFDVCSLYSNVSLKSILKSLEKRWDDIKKNTKIKRDSFMRAVTIGPATSNRMEYTGVSDLEQRWESHPVQ